MEDDQQFCLRWNNHQSTLVAVFDTLLENGTLVDCTLAAEGKFLNAHKVVLSACSPYFESLLSQNYDKHPIFILKDVKFQELKAMMDYMYRGEVNISQDQLGALLKAAESLQIKGLSDNKKEGAETRKQPPPPAKSPPPTASLPRVQGLTIEQRRANRNVDDREGSQSPGPRKRKRMRRRSTDDLDNHHDASNSSESHSNPAPIQNIPIALPLASSSKISTDVPEPVETKSEILTRHKANESELPQVPILKEKIETHSELMLEPKAEYVDEMNEESIEDLTLDDDDDVSNLEMSNDGAGPSHGNAGEGSSQGFGGWHMGNQNQDEVFLAAQEAVGAHRDSQEGSTIKLDPEVMKTSPEMVEVVTDAASNLMPTKLSSTYENVYGRFMKWRGEKDINSYSEDVLLAYFSELATKMKMKSPTMWAYYSMIKIVLNIKHGIDIKQYLKLRAYLEKLNESYTLKKSRAFTKGQFDKFLSDACDDKYLGMKVALIIGISGGCRCDELVKMTIDDIEDLGSLLRFNIVDSKTNKTRSFTVMEEMYINLYRKYLSLRPMDFYDRRFFLKYNNGKCCKTVLGIHKIATVPKEVACFLKLPNWKEFTGHCFKKTSATLLE